MNININTMPEINLWQNVLINAALDAINDEQITERFMYDAEYHLSWSKSYWCKKICEFAQLDYSMVVNTFEDIYNNRDNNKYKNKVKDRSIFFNNLKGK